MSLLDFKMPGLDTAEGQGIMAAALSLLQAQKMPGQRGLAGALGGAGQQYMQTSGQARQQAMQSKLQGAQLAQYEALNKERERKFLEEQAAAADPEMLRVSHPPPQASYPLCPECGHQRHPR